MSGKSIIFAATLAIALCTPMNAQAETKDKDAPKIKPVPRTDPGCVRACAGGRIATDSGSTTAADAAVQPATQSRMWVKTSQTSENGLLCKWISDDNPPKEQWQNCANNHSPR